MMRPVRGLRSQCGGDLAYEAFRYFRKGLSGTAREIVGFINLWVDGGEMKFELPFQSSSAGKEQTDWLNFLSPYNSHSYEREADRLISFAAAVIVSGLDNHKASLFFDLTGCQ
jgi:hypothetical protein